MKTTPTAKGSLIALGVAALFAANASRALAGSHSEGEAKPAAEAGDKNSCSGPNGCSGKADAAAPAGADKKSEKNSCGGPNGCGAKAPEGAAKSGS